MKSEGKRQEGSKIWGVVKGGWRLRRSEDICIFFLLSKLSETSFWFFVVSFRSFFVFLCIAITTSTYIYLTSVYIFLVSFFIPFFQGCHRRFFSSYFVRLIELMGRYIFCLPFLFFIFFSFNRRTVFPRMFIERRNMF